MASASGNPDEDGVHFVRDDDGTVTAVDEETGLARGGDTKADALARLTEVLALHEDAGERIDDPETFLREALDVEPSDADEDLPGALQ